VFVIGSPAVLVQHVADLIFIMVISALLVTWFLVLADMPLSPGSPLLI
jgi:hypothetical protein